MDGAETLKDESWDQERVLTALAQGTRHRLSGLADTNAPATPGLYALWHGDEFLYVGIAYRDPGETKNAQAAGVRGRLRTYLNAHLTSDFVVAVVLRYVVADFDAVQLQQLASGQFRVSDVRAMAKAWVAEHVEFTAVATDGTTARNVETKIRHDGLPGYTPPAFNATTRTEWKTVG